MTATAEEVWTLLREVVASQKDTDRKFQDTALKFQETDRKFQETDRKFQDTDRKFQETDRKFQDTDRKFQETDRKFQDTDRKFQDTDRKFQETDRKLKEVLGSIGRLGNKLGEFVEEMVKPAVVRLFRERGIAVHEVHRGVSAERDGEAIEIDLLVVNDADVVAVECKNSLSIEDVDEHLARLGRVRRLLPRYREARVMGAVAAMVLPDDVARYAYRQGLFVLAQSGDSVTLRNDARFVPKTW